MKWKIILSIILIIILWLAVDRSSLPSILLNEEACQEYCNQYNSQANFSKKEFCYCQKDGKTIKGITERIPFAET